MRYFAPVFVIASLAALFAPCYAFAASENEPAAIKAVTGVESFDKLSLERKLLAVDGVAMSSMVLTGLSSWWHKGSDLRSFENDRYDGWFGRNEPYAGIDKVGHAFGTYAVSRAMIGAYTWLGMERDKAVLRGVFMGWLVASMVEVGDAFTEHGFGPNDIAANGAGALFAWALETNPRLDDLLDFRVEYVPTGQFYDGDVGSPINDYMGMKYLLVVKAAGIGALAKGPLRYLEFHAGYYTRKYPTKFHKNGDRYLYAGVSISLTQIFKELAGGDDENPNAYAQAASTLFRYYQAPGISIERDNLLD